MDIDSKEIRQRAILLIFYGAFFCLFSLRQIILAFSDISRSPLSLYSYVFLFLAIYLLILISGIYLLKNNPVIRVIAPVLITLLLLRFILQMSSLTGAINNVRGTLLEIIVVPEVLRASAFSFILTIMDFFVWVLIQNSIEY